MKLRISGIISICFLAFATSCSMPNLETANCTEARNAVKKLYSFHVGNDMNPTVENLKLRSAFLTPELASNVQGQTSGKFDYFTQTDDYPKTFRVGTCTEITEKNEANIQVIVFWKDDVRNEQKELKVAVVNQDQNWLINKVE